jgi:hypothetical protein
VVQADVDQNETDADAAIALKRDISDSYTNAEVDSAVAVVQADVDQNETDADAAIALKRDISDSYTKAQVDSAMAAKQDDLTVAQQAVVDGTAFSASEKAKVAYVDVSSGLTALLAAKQDDLTVAQQAVVDGTAFSASEKAKVAYVDVSSGLTALLAAKQNTVANDHLQIAHTAGLQTALSAKLSSTGENQGITQNSAAAILTLTNLTADTKTISCVGGDGSVSIVSGVAVECDRQGPMYVRNNMGSGSVVLQARSVNAIVVDDKVTVPVSFVLTKAAPADEDAAGTHNELRVSGNTLYLYSSATSKWRTLASQGWA